VGIAWLVNRQPQRIGLIYRPATGAALLLLWSLIVAALLYSGGLHLPPFSLDVFAERASATQALVGLVRLLAILVGIEAFAALEPAFSGDDRQRAGKTAGSLLLAAGTSLAMLLFFGPVLSQLAQPDRPGSAMSQAMQVLLPGPWSGLGALIAVAVLLSTAAASAHALQNLSLGLRTRRFAPMFLAQRNRLGVPDRPVWAAGRAGSPLLPALGHGRGTLSARLCRWLVAVADHRGLGRVATHPAR
jgi:hypothetical protein